jgi:dTDP-4-amino-4,6-dideoxygalactose transaminase
MGIGDDLVGGVEQLLVSNVIQRRALFRMVGPASQAWRAESDIARIHAGMHCLLLPSASTGLALILEQLALPEGSEVLIAPFGWVANWSAIARAGLSPRFVPLDARLQMRCEAVADRITDRTSAVIVTHLMGRGQQAVADIAALCQARGIPLLEDIAQSFGVSVRGRRAGTHGVAAWCSLNHHKILSSGDGGFILVQDGSMFDRIAARHDQGNILRNGKRRRVEPVEPGLSLRVNEVTAAVVRAQLARFHLLRGRILRLHAAIARAATAAGLRTIEPHEGDLPFTVLFRRPAGWSYPSLLDSGWHVATNVPWLAETTRTAAALDPAIAETDETLAGISAIGAGFIDPYYAIPKGLLITDDASGADAVVATLERGT